MSDGSSSEKDPADELDETLLVGQGNETVVGPSAGSQGPVDQTVTFQDAATSAGQSSVHDNSNLPEQFGRYRVKKRLGQGAMGAVFLAQDTQLDRDVAIKVPFFNPNDGQEVIDRFYREARAMATLRHANLCPVYDVGQINGIHYLTMAFINGRPLADYLKKEKPLPAKQVAALARKLALALHAAHQAGIVHRDLKPANIMIDEHNEPIVMDFGLARRSTENEKELTQSGAILGSPAYMSPEQVEAQQDKIGPCTDVYALGVIIYRMICAKLPFEGSMASVLGKIVMKVPDQPSEVHADVDPAIEAICMKAMAKNIEDRYESAKALAADVSRFLKGQRPNALESDTDDELQPPGAVVGASTQPNEDSVNVSERSTDRLTHELFDRYAEIESRDTPSPQRVPTVAPTTSKQSEGILRNIPAWAWFAGAGGAAVLVVILLVILGGGGEDETKPNQAADKTPAKSPSPDPRRPTATPQPSSKTVVTTAPRELFRDSGQKLGSSDSLHVALADFDRDGDLDALVSNYAAPDTVWLNDGRGQFRDSGQRLGDTRSTRTCIGDLDGDGDLDLFVPNVGNQPNRVLLNDGRGVFSDSGQRLGRNGSKCAALADFDGDGDLDAVTANYYQNQPNRIWINNGKALFTDSGQALGTWASEGLAVGDFDGDRDTDVFVCNKPNQPNRVYLNDGQGVLTDSGQELGAFMSIGVGIGDLDADGDLDALVTNHGPNRIWINNGNGQFTLGEPKIGESNSIWPELADLDADGDLDVFVVNSKDTPNTVWMNDGEGGFEKTHQALGNSDSNGVALGDLDRDGDLDAFVVNAGSQPNQVYLNQLRTPSASPRESPTEVLTSDQWSWSKPVALGSGVSQRDAYESGPSVTDDELILVFSRDNNLWISQRESIAQPFQQAEPIKAVNSESEERDPSISGDGRLLVFGSNRGLGEDIWMSERPTTRAQFGKPRRLGRPVNSEFTERSAEISSDGLILIVGSSRPGGRGKSDLWMFTRNTRRELFGNPVNLGPNINTEYWDSAPAISSDGLTLIYGVSRPQPGVIDAQDLWMSTRESRDQPFGPRRPLAFLNTKACEFGPAVSGDGRALYFESTRNGGARKLWVVRRMRK